MKEDLPAVLSLLEENSLPADGLRQHLGTILVVRKSSEVMGSAALEPYAGAALLRSVAVRGELRGKGLGRRLVDAAIELAAERGANNVYLLTEDAEDFFARLGFRQISRTDVRRASPEVTLSVQFTSACPESAQAMALSLPGAPVDNPLRL
ncbi:MAG: arsenic resistance N-acetyltransferase ArsN2 [Rubrobacteraceae bacterium]